MRDPDIIEAAARAREADDKYQRMVTKERTPTARPWPDIIYDNNIDPTLEVEDGSWPSLGDYTEWWEIPGIARFEREADAYLALDAVNSIAPIKEALAEIGKLIDMIDCTDKHNLSLLPLFLAELQRADAALARMEQP